MVDCFYFIINNVVKGQENIYLNTTYYKIKFLSPQQKYSNNKIYTNYKIYIKLCTIFKTNKYFVNFAVGSV